MTESELSFSAIAQNYQIILKISPSPLKYIEFSSRLQTVVDLAENLLCHTQLFISERNCERPRLFKQAVVSNKAHLDR